MARRLCRILTRMSAVLLRSILERLLAGPVLYRPRRSGALAGRVASPLTFLRYLLVSFDSDLSTFAGTGQ